MTKGIVFGVAGVAASVGVGNAATEGIVGDSVCDSRN